MAKSFKRSIHLSFYTLFFTFVFIFAFSLSLISFIPIYLFRFFATTLRKLFRPDLGKLVTTRSAVLAGTDDPTNDPKWNLCVWLVLEGEKLNFEQFRINFYNNIILKKTATGQFHSPEYQQYLHKWLGFMFWKWEKEFNVNEHMRYLFPDNVNKIMTKEELRQTIKHLAWSPFQRNKSPWEFLYVPNYVDASSDTEQPDKSVLIFRVHHGFCDGFSILHLLLKEINNVSLSGVAKPETVKKNLLQKFIHGLLFVFVTPWKFMHMLVRTADTNDWHLPNNKLNRPYNTGFTERIPLSYIKEIKSVHGVSFSAVIYSSITGALRSAMMEAGKNVPPYISTGVAVPMPGHPLKLRNHFIFSFLQLPTGIDDPIKRIQKVERNIQKLKRSSVPLFSFGLIPMIGGTFATAMKLFSANTYSTVLTSNFPGPPNAGYFIGGGNNNTKVIDMNFAAGLGEGNVGIGFCMMSYAEGMRIITSFADNILPTDYMVDLFNKKLLDEMETLRRSPCYV